MLGGTFLDSASEYYSADLTSYITDGYIVFHKPSDVLTRFELRLTLKEGYTYSAYLVRELVYQLDTTNIANVKLFINGEEKNLQSVYTDFFGEEKTFASAINTTKGTLTFQKNFPPEIEGENNIIVEFDKEIEGNADKINKCQFGIMFGYSDMENLFVSGIQICRIMIFIQVIQTIQKHKAEYLLKKI